MIGSNICRSFKRILSCFFLILGAPAAADDAYTAPVVALAVEPYGAPALMTFLIRVGRGVQDSPKKGTL